jgi:hypothetical protein
MEMLMAFTLFSKHTFSFLYENCRQFDKVHMRPLNKGTVTPDEETDACRLFSLDRQSIKNRGFVFEINILNHKVL